MMEKNSKRQEKGKPCDNNNITYREDNEKNKKDIIDESKFCIILGFIME